MNTLGCANTSARRNAAPCSRRGRDSLRGAARRPAVDPGFRRNDTKVAALVSVNPHMRLDEAIRTRRSVRGFLPREVPQALLHEDKAIAARVGRLAVDAAVRFHR